MKKHISSLFFLAFFSSSVMADEIMDCDPVVSLDPQIKTLQKTLTVLAKEYQFELSFPLDADKAVETVDGMRLTQAVKYLSSDVNMVLQHEKIKACEQSRLVAMEVLPVGENSEYVYVTSSGEKHHSAQKIQPGKNINRTETELQAKDEKTGALKFRGDTDSDEGADVEQMRKEQARSDFDRRPEQIEAARETGRRGKILPGVEGSQQSGRKKSGDEEAY